MANEPGQAVLTVLDQIIERIKSTRPMRSDNKPLETGFVYSQLVLGQMVDPDDFANPWSPMGGSTVHDALKDGKLPANAGASVATGTPATPAADGSAQGGGADPAVSAKLRRALQAAFNTSQLVDRLIMVTRDETMREYPGGGRTISFAYEGIVNGMQPLPAPPLAPEVQKRLDDARKVLYEFDEDGEIAGKSKLYKTYVKNARAYAEAKSDFADAQAAALQDPVKAESWPMKSVTLQQSVDEAYDTLKTEGAEKVEAALAVIESIGISIQDRMIAKARKIFDAWNLGLSGVPTQTPYSSVLPSGWADPDEDMDGWYHLTVDRSSYANHSGQNSHFFQQSSSHGDSSSTNAQGSASFFGFGASGGGGSSSSHNNSQGSVESTNSTFFKNDAEGLSIELEYGLCDIMRPWFMGDLFYMKNWYLVNNAAKAISDGTIEGQADSEKTLLPMIPMQFLVVRNVKIRATKWNSDGQTLETLYGSNRSDSSASSSSWNAGARAGFGPFSFGASVNRSKSSSDSSQSSGVDTSARRDFEASFDGETLTIKGAQIISWLSTIVPPCALIDDPGLKKESTPAPAPEPATV